VARPTFATINRNVIGFASFFAIRSSLLGRSTLRRSIEVLEARKSRQPNLGWGDALAEVLREPHPSLTDDLKRYRTLAYLEGLLPATD